MIKTTISHKTEESAYRDIADAFVSLVRSRGAAWTEAFDVPRPVVGAAGAYGWRTAIGIDRIAMTLAGYTDPRWYTLWNIEDPGKAWSLRDGCEWVDLVNPGVRFKTKIFEVYNAEEIVGIPPYDPADFALSLFCGSPLECVEAMCDGLGVRLDLDNEGAKGGTLAYYNPLWNVLRVPNLEKVSENDFMLSSLRELADACIFRKYGSDQIAPEYQNNPWRASFKTYLALDLATIFTAKSSFLNVSSLHFPYPDESCPPVKQRLNIWCDEIFRDPWYLRDAAWSASSIANTLMDAFVAGRRKAVNEGTAESFFF